MCFFFPTGLDYKKLISVGSPQQILKPVLTSANVHLLAKLANKIPIQVSEVVCRVRSVSLSPVENEEILIFFLLHSVKEKLLHVFFLMSTLVLFFS